MAKRHTNWCLQQHDDEDVTLALKIEMLQGREKYGSFSSWHELAAVLREEFEEFWDGVKDDDPDPKELIQVAAVACSGLLQLCQQARAEMEDMQRDNEKRENERRERRATEGRTR